MKQWQNIIVHCSDSTWGNASIIKDWHHDRGWSDIGYHFVIQNGHPWNSSEFISLLNGAVEPGRRLDLDLWAEENEVGAHTLGYNSTSIGICLVGKDRFSVQQFVALKLLLEFLMNKFQVNRKNVIGHRDTESGKEQGKTCPNFDVREFMNEYAVGIGEGPV